MFLIDLMSNFFYRKFFPWLVLKHCHIDSTLNRLFNILKNSFASKISCLAFLQRRVFPDYSFFGVSMFNSQSFQVYRNIYSTVFISNGKEPNPVYVQRDAKLAYDCQDGNFGLKLCYFFQIG